MSTKVTYSCDRCGHSQEGTNGMYNLQPGQRQIWAVAIRLGTNGIHDLMADWCRPCCIEMGILKPAASGADAPTVAPETKPTLEDVVREIVRQEIAEQ